MMIMQWLRKTAVIALALSLAPAAVAACLVPLAEPTATERECCRIMPADCDQRQMPVAHACCQPTVRTETVVFVAAKSFSAAPPLESSGPVDTASVSTAPGLAAADGTLFTIHSPPESPPGAVTILRI